MKVFDDYVKKFDMNLDGVYLKYHHSYRVQKYEEQLAKSLNMSDSDLKLASICGLFHDIARFEQYTKYHTFDDDKSIDHGDYGYEILKDGLIDQLDLNDDEKNILLLSTKNHNKYSIDKNIKGRELTFCKLIRDADKLDILDLFANRVISHNLLEGDLSISEKCHEQFINHQQISWTFVKTNGDRILVYLGLVWDFNFPKSYEIIEEKQIFKTIKEIVTFPQFDIYFKLIEEKMKEELK